MSEKLGKLTKSLEKLEKEEIETLSAEIAGEIKTALGGTNWIYVNVNYNCSNFNVTLTGKPGEEEGVEPPGGNFAVSSALGKPGEDEGAEPPGGNA